VSQVVHCVSSVNEICALLYQDIHTGISAYISLLDDKKYVYLVRIPEPVLYVTRSDKTSLIVLVSSFDFSSQT